MERQFLVAVLGAVTAWWLIERFKAVSEAAVVDPVAGVADQESASEIMV